MEHNLQTPELKFVIDRQENNISKKYRLMNTYNLYLLYYLFSLQVLFR